MSDIPLPTPDDLARDGPADLTVCEAATPGPWEPCRSVTCGHLRAAHNYREAPSEEWTDADLRFIALARAALPAWVRRAWAAEAFKRWVHAWLDAAGVPHDPDPEHTRAHGCRISGRLRYLLSRGRKEAATPCP
jgi:hypothetical protein